MKIASNHHADMLAKKKTVQYTSTSPSFFNILNAAFVHSILLLFQNTVELHHSKPLATLDQSSGLLLSHCVMNSSMASNRAVGTLKTRLLFDYFWLLVSPRVKVSWSTTTLTTHLKHTQTHSFPVFCLIFRAWFMISIGAMLVVLCFLLIFLLLALLCLCASRFTKNWGLRPTCLFYFTQNLETNRSHESETNIMNHEHITF